MRAFADASGVPFCITSFVSSSSSCIGALDRVTITLLFLASYWFITSANEVIYVLLVSFLGSGLAVTDFSHGIMDIVRELVRRTILHRAFRKMKNLVLRDFVFTAVAIFSMASVGRGGSFFDSFSNRVVLLTLSGMRFLA